MEAQQTLFDYRYPPHQRHSETSVAAAEDIQPSINELQSRVLNLLRQYPNGLTDDEMQMLLSMNPSTQRPRRIELLAKGLIKNTEAKRATRSGRLAYVWGAI